MGARSAMTQRAVHKRNSTSSQHDSPSLATIDSSFPCWIYKNNRESQLVRDGAKTLEVKTMRALVPLSKDIRDGDFFTSVVDRNGAAVFSTFLEVLAVEPHHSHKEVILRDTGRTS